MERWQTGEPPKETGEYRVIHQMYWFGRQVRQADRVENPKGHWYWLLHSSGDDRIVNDKDIIAWQKCPEPYQG